jgi:hypothetical protein
MKCEQKTVLFAAARQNQRHGHATGFENFNKNTKMTTIRLHFEKLILKNFEFYVFLLQNWKK